MKKPYRTWRGQPILDAEHEYGLGLLKPKQKRWLDIIFEGTDLCPRCRMHKHLTDFPCIYVFRNSRLAADKRGMIFHTEQPRRNEDMIQIVFRHFYDQLPLPEYIWNDLKPDLLQKHLFQTQRAFDISTDRDALAAQSLVRACIVIFDSIYGNDAGLENTRNRSKNADISRELHDDRLLDLKTARSAAFHVYEKVKDHSEHLVPKLDWAFDLFEILTEHPAAFSFHEYTKRENRHHLNHLFFEFIDRIRQSDAPENTLATLSEFAPSDSDETHWFMRSQSISYIVHCIKPTHCFALTSLMHRTLKIYGIDDFWISKNEERFREYLKLLAIMLQAPQSESETFFIDFTLKMSPLMFRKASIWQPLVQNPEKGREFMRAHFIDASDELFLDDLAKLYNQKQFKIKSKQPKSPFVRTNDTNQAPFLSPVIEKPRFIPAIMSLDLPDTIPDEFKAVFEHIFTFGAITESALIRKLGGGNHGARKSRRFTSNLEQWLPLLPFDIEIIGTIDEGNEYRKKPRKGNTDGAVKAGN
jgi:hypothetical protein